MKSTLDQLRAAFRKNDNDNNRQNNYYPFWDMPDGSQAVVRFLPDANEQNPMLFLTEKLMHILVINGENRSVPCLRMYGEECPICKVSQAFYNEQDKINGKKYWRKKQHIAQVLVVEDPLPPDDVTGETHEGKVRLVALGYQLFNILKDAFESGELDKEPYAYEGGTNFIIKKTKQGEYSNYSLSKFTRKSSDLTDEEIAHVTDNIIDLSTLMPQHPGLEKVESMLEAALTGANYVEHEGDDEPSPLKFVGKTSSKQAEQASPVTTDATSKDTTDDYEDEADKILAQIRARQANKA